MWVGAVAQELFITDRKRMVANSTVLRPKAAAVGSQSHQAAIFKFTSSSIVCCVLSQVHYFELLVQRAIGIQIFSLNNGSSKRNKVQAKLCLPVSIPEKGNHAVNDIH